jgi:hypothetical protein
MLDLLAVDRVRLVRALDDAARDELGDDLRSAVEHAGERCEPERDPADLAAGEPADR